MCVCACMSVFLHLCADVIVYALCACVGGYLHACISMFDGATVCYGVCVCVSGCAFVCVCLGSIFVCFLCVCVWEGDMWGTGMWEMCGMSI